MQKPFNNPKITLQELRSDMLKHPNGNNPIIDFLPSVVRRRCIPIITKQDTNPSTVRQPSIANSLLSKRLLLLGERHARHVTTSSLRSSDGHIAPTAADIEEVVRSVKPEFADKVVDFALLRGF